MSSTPDRSQRNLGATANGFDDFGAERGAMRVDVLPMIRHCCKNTTDVGSKQPGTE